MPTNTTETLEEARGQLVRVIADHPNIGTTWKSWNDADGNISNDDLFYFGFEPKPEFLKALNPAARAVFLHSRQFVRLPSAMWSAAPAPQHRKIVDGYAATDLPGLLEGVRAIARISRERASSAQAAAKAVEVEAPSPMQDARATRVDYEEKE
jgi:hypothetical protein